MRLPWLIALCALLSLPGAGEIYLFRAPVPATAAVTERAGGVLEIHIAQTPIRSLPGGVAEAFDDTLARQLAHQTLFRLLGGKGGEALTCSGLTLVSAEEAEGRFRTHWTIRRADCALGIPTPEGQAKPEPPPAEKASPETDPETKPKQEKNEDEANP